MQNGSGCAPRLVPGRVGFGFVPPTPAGDHPDVATAYSELGGSYRSKGDFAKALEVDEKALRNRAFYCGPL